MNDVVSPLAVAVADLGAVGNSSGATAILTGVTVAAGASIVVGISTEDTALGTVSDSAGNTYQLVDSSAYTGASAASFGGVFVALNITNALSAGSITYTKSTVGVRAILAAGYATGVSGALVDTAVTTHAINNTAVTSGSVVGGTPSAAGQAHFGFAAYSSGSNRTLTLVGAGWTTPPFTTNTSAGTRTQDGGGYIIPAGATAQTFSFTLSGTATFAAFIISLAVPVIRPHSMLMMFD
jgi:hypothetical protein